MIDRQAERREFLENEKRLREGTTFSQFAKSESDEPRGRFTATEKAAVIDGVTPSYPKGPDWAVDPVPKEEPLNYDINAMEPVGTPAEIQASIDKVSPLESSLAQGNSGGAVTAPASAPPLVDGVETAALPTSTEKR